MFVFASLTQMDAFEMHIDNFTEWQTITVRIRKAWELQRLSKEN